MRASVLRAFVTAAVLAGHAATVSAQSKVITIGPDGQVIGPPPALEAGDHLRFVLPASALELRLAFRDEIDQPVDLSALRSAVTLTSEDGEVFYTERVPRNARVLLYNVTEPRVATPLSPELQMAVTNAQTAFDGLKTAQDGRRKKVNELLEEVKQLAASVQVAVDAVLLRQESIGHLRQDIVTAEPLLEAAKTTLDAAKTALQQGQSGTFNGQVLRLGALVVGKTRKVVNYRLIRGGPPERPISLERIADYPLVVQDDELFAMITNARRGERPEQFVLSFGSTPGTAPDPAGSAILQSRRRRRLPRQLSRRGGL